MGHKHSKEEVPLQTEVKSLGGPLFLKTILHPKNADLPMDPSPIFRSKSAWETGTTKWSPALRSKSLPVVSARRADINLDEETMMKVAQLQAELVVKKRVQNSLDMTIFFAKKCSRFAHGIQQLSAVAVRTTSGILPPHVVVQCLKGSKGTSDHGPNQDNFSYCEFEGYELLAVLDGHGGGGHFVSFRASQSILYFVCNSEHFPSNISEAIREAYRKCQADLISYSIQKSFDIQVSGAACVLLVRRANDVWLSHTGDSRMLIGNKDSPEVKLETTDHKPTNERTRLEACGAEVQTFQFEQGAVEISRVYVKGTDYPGLCMSRSLGDLCVKSCGVSADPDIATYTIGSGDYIVLASDGVWEFVPSHLITNSFSKKLELEGAQKCADRIVTEAKKRWNINEGAYCDDITAMIIRF